MSAVVDRARPGGITNINQDVVLPAYRAVVAGPPVEEKVAAAHQVTVTLVRWPFT